MNFLIVLLLEHLMASKLSDVRKFLRMVTNGPETTFYDLQTAETTSFGVHSKFCISIDWQGANPKKSVCTPEKIPSSSTEICSCPYTQNKLSYLASVKRKMYVGDGFKLYNSIPTVKHYALGLFCCQSGSSAARPLYHTECQHILLTHNIFSRNSQ